MTKETRQLIMFLLGVEQGEILRAFSEKRISKAEYDKRCHAVYVATTEVMECIAI